MLLNDLIKIKSVKKYHLKADFRIILIKSIGLYSTLGFILFLYWLLPEYGDWYNRYWDVLTLAAPFLATLPPAYLYLLYRYQKDYKDSNYHFGLLFLALFNFQLSKKVSYNHIFEHIRQWVIKGFFLPLMMIFLFNNITSLLNFNYNNLNQGFNYIFDYANIAIFTLDLVFAACGYLFTFKLIKTDIRSAEPSLLGWLVCLLCYPPFWNGLFNNLYFKYENDYFWGQWLWNEPIAYGIWGSTIILLLLIYSLATVSLGYRFSNLTYRGLTTSGVYRFSKHPAYIAKNLSWWMIAIPFISTGNLEETIRSCILLLALNYIYYLRAKTEERHLSQYPEYVEYAEWMNKNGIFRWLSRIVPFLAYSEQKTLAKATPVWWKLS